MKIAYCKGKYMVLQKIVQNTYEKGFKNWKAVEMCICVCVCVFCNVQAVQGHILINYLDHSCAIAMSSNMSGHNFTLKWENAQCLINTKKWLYLCKSSPRQKSQSPLLPATRRYTDYYTLWQNPNKIHNMGHFQKCLDLMFRII